MENRSKRPVAVTMTRAQSQAALRAICEVLRKLPDGSSKRALESARDAIFDSLYGTAEQGAA